MSMTSKPRMSEAEIVDLSLIPVHSPQIEEPLGKLFEALFYLGQNKDQDPAVMIAIGHKRSYQCTVRFSSGEFTHSQGEWLIPVEGALAQVWTGLHRHALLHTPEFMSDEPSLRRFPKGEVVFFHIDLGGQHAALLAIWQPQTQGSLSDEKLRAYQNLANLTEEAVQAALAREKNPRFENRLNLVRNENVFEPGSEFYEQYADSIHQCFWVFDVGSSHLLRTSENFEKVWGCSPDCLNDGLTGFMKNIHPRDRDRVLSDFHTSLGSSFSSEMRVLDSSGEIRWMWLRSFQKEVLEGGRVYKHIIFISTDISEKKLQEEDLRSREAQLASNARTMAVSDLANGVAHEINNPLTIIVGRAAALRARAERGSLSAQDVIDATDKIQKTSIRIADIISSLKSLSRQDKDLMMQAVSLEKVLNDVKDTISEKFKTHHVHLDLPAVSAQLVADMNPTLVSQMIFNLLSNSLDAVLNLEERWVRVDAFNDKDSLFIAVTDSGHGVPIRVRSRIFDPFFTTKGPDKGSGLGLSLASAIAARHHGSIALDTLHPHTRFVIQLPKRQAHGKKQKAA